MRRQLTSGSHSVPKAPHLPYKHSCTLTHIPIHQHTLPLQPGKRPTLNHRGLPPLILELQYNMHIKYSFEILHLLTNQISITVKYLKSGTNLIGQCEAPHMQYPISRQCTGHSLTNGIISSLVHPCLWVRQHDQDQHPPGNR